MVSLLVGKKTCHGFWSLSAVGKGSQRVLICVLQELMSRVGVVFRVPGLWEPNVLGLGVSGVDKFRVLGKAYKRIRPTVDPKLALSSEPAPALPSLLNPEQ